MVSACTIIWSVCINVMYFSINFVYWLGLVVFFSSQIPFPVEGLYFSRVYTQYCCVSQYEGAFLC